MRFIPTRIHAIVDYVTGILLIAAPFIFRFADGGAAQWVPMLLGTAIIIMSLMTDYELSMSRMIPVPAHLMVDAAGGLLLLGSPWIFGFADRVWVPHVVFGVLEAGLALATQTSAESGEAATD